MRSPINNNVGQKLEARYAVNKRKTIVPLFSFLLLLACPQDEEEGSSPFGGVESDAQEEGEQGDGEGEGDASEGGKGESGDEEGDTVGDGEDETGEDDGEPCGNIGEACSGDTCCDGLSCVEGICALGGGDGDGDGDGDLGEDPWSPEACLPPSEVVGVVGLVGDFCSSPCINDADCPPSPEGTQAACVLIAMEGEPPSSCAMICELAQITCPSGSTCKDLMNPNYPGSGLCTYP